MSHFIKIYITKIDADENDTDGDQVFRTMPARAWCRRAAGIVFLCCWASRLIDFIDFITFFGSVINQTQRTCLWRQYLSFDWNIMFSQLKINVVSRRVKTRKYCNKPISWCSGCIPLSWAHSLRTSSLVHAPNMPFSCDTKRWTAVALQMDHRTGI